MRNFFLIEKNFYFIIEMFKLRKSTSQMRNCIKSKTFIFFCVFSIVMFGFYWRFSCMCSIEEIHRKFLTRCKCAKEKNMQKSKAGVSARWATSSDPKNSIYLQMCSLHSTMKCICLIFERDWNICSFIYIYT
jgi:hypothetical protein